MDTVNPDVCVLMIIQRDREQTRHFQVKVSPQSLLPGAVTAEQHVCASESLGGLWQNCALGPTPRISHF